MRQKLGILFCTLIILSNPSTLLAQTASSSATPRSNSSSSNSIKNTVKNFKINLNQYSSFGTDCAQKSKGDANCDTKINDFDLSIWEVEFNSSNPPKRADFNNDGVVNLLDYGIWRNTTYPASTTSQGIGSEFLSTLIDLISKQNPMSQTRIVLGAFLGQLGELEIRNYFTVYAQESGGGEINSSSTFTSGSGNSIVLNTITGGSTQQVNFNQDGNPQSASFFDPNGQSYAEVAFTNSGTIIATQDNGIPITISKTSSGPIIENFKNPDGSLLAIKSWPSQESYDSNQPPIAVTIPGQGATKEVLNMQPNGDGIVEKLDAAGNILNRTQLRSNGTIVTEDLRNQIMVQSNTEIGFTNLSMKNNLGGQTQYMFYQGSLYAIVQTDSGKNAYVSKPLNDSGLSWTFETLDDGVKRQEKITTDPIAEAKSNTPNPQSLIQNINYYKQASLPTDSVTFSEGFTSTAPAIKNPVDRANSILAISQAQTPGVLGLSIVKEVRADQKPGDNDQQAAHTNSNNQPTGQVTVVGVGLGSEQQGQVVTNVVTMTSYGNSAQGGLGTVPGSTVTFEIPSTIQVPTFQNGQEAVGWAQGLISTQVATNVQVQGRDSDLGAAMVALNPPGTPTNNQPAAPAAGIAQQPPPAPAAPVGGTGKSESQQALEAAAKAAAENGGSPAAQGRAAYDAALAAAQGFNMPTEKAGNLANDAFSHSFLAAALREAGVPETDIQGKTGAELSSLAQTKGIDLDKVNDARSEQGLSNISSPFSAQSTAAGPPNTTPSAAAAAAATAPSLPDRNTSMGFGNGMTSTITGYVDTQIGRAGFEGFASNITDANGNLVATQISDPTTGRSDWTDAATGDTYTANSGALTAASIDVSAAGSIVGISAYDGSLVAVGDASFINEQGYIEGGRPATEQEVAAFQEQQAEQAAATGAEQYSVSFDPDATGRENWSDNGYSGNSIDQGGNFGGEQVGSQAGPDTSSDTSPSSNENFNNDTSNGSDANSSGADSSGW